SKLTRSSATTPPNCTVRPSIRSSVDPAFRAGISIDPPLSFIASRATRREYPLDRLALKEEAHLAPRDAPSFRRFPELVLIFADEGRPRQLHRLVRVLLAAAVEGEHGETFGRLIARRGDLDVGADMARAKLVRPRMHHAADRIMADDQVAAPVEDAVRREQRD